MEEDKIKEIFSKFEPPLSGESQFLNRLEENMRSVELVREHSARVRSMNRKAVLIGVAVGFICGFLFSLALPAIGESMMKLRQTVAAGSFLGFISHNYLPMIWAMIAAVAGFIALNAFELSLFLMERRERVER